MASSRVQGLLLALILLFAGVFRISVIDVPFGRNPEGCAAFFGLVARNYFRYDFAQHHGVPVISLGRGAPVVYYANHPPTTPLLVGLVFALTGYRGQYDGVPGEWQVRLPTALFTLGCIALLYPLIRNRAGPRAGLLAAAIFAMIPMTLVYGGFSDVINPQLVFMALLTIAAYERFHDAPDAKRLAILALCFLGAAIMDWPAFHMVPVLCLHYVLTRKPRQWGWIIAFGGISIVIFSTLYVYLALAQHDWLWMKALIAKRSISGAEDNNTHFTLGQWIKRTGWDYVIGRHTLAVIALALLGLGRAISRRFRGPAGRMAGLLLVWAMVHILIGAQAVYQHEWWWWPLTPGVVITAAIGLDWMMTGLSRGWRLPARAMNIGVATLLILFAGWNVRAAWYELTRDTNIGTGANQYSLQEIGDAIRSVAGPDEAVMLVEHDDSLDLFYYADRAIKTQVWDAEAFQKKLNDPYAELNFNQFEPWSGPTTAIVVPKYYVEASPKVMDALLGFLDGRYKRENAGKFFVYRLAGGNE